MNPYTDGVLPAEVNPSYLQPDTSGGILDYVNPFAETDPTPMAPIPMQQGSDPFAQSLAKFAGAPATDANKLQDINFDWDRTKADRYVNSDYYKTLGVDPFGENESKYGYHQTVGDTLQQAFGGAWKLGVSTFIDGWKGWARMADALFSWDASKIMGAPEDLAQLSKQQNDAMNYWAIFSTPESEDGLFNRQFFGNMVQQGGFMLGTMAQFLAEEYLTAGMSTWLSAPKEMVSMVRAAKVLERAELLRNAKRLGDGVWQSSKIVDGLYKGLRKLVPLADTVHDIAKYNRAGANLGALALRGVAGLKRDLAEANMAFTEARMEAAGTYGDLTDRLKEDFRTSYGKNADYTERQRIGKLAQAAAMDNFKVNAGVLMVMNRLQFDNMFSSFNPDRMLFGKVASSMADDILEVSSQAGVKKVYQKGALGTIGLAREIASDFGRKKAAVEIGKSVASNTFHWEISEGVQELIQEGSNNAVQDYYASLYNGNPHTWSESIKAGVRSQGNMQGLKTFLMGAVTGRLMSPLNFAITKVNHVAGTTRAERADYKASVAENVALINQFYENPRMALPEWIANIQVQGRAATGMKEALRNRDKYAFYNAKDSAFAKTVAAAKKLDLVPSVLDTIEGYGEHMSDDEFKTAFNIEATDQNRIQVKEFVGKIAADIREYQQEWNRLNDKFGDLVMPRLAGGQHPHHREMLFAKRALDDAIEVLATTRHQAKRWAERANELQSQAAAVPGIGNALSSAYRVLTSESNTNSEIALLKAELNSIVGDQYQDQQTRALVAQKKQRIRALEEWSEYRNKFSEDKAENKSFTTKMLGGYRMYLHSHLNEGKLESLSDHSPRLLITDEEMNDTFFNLNDYIKLNKQAQGALDALNTIADPFHFHKFHTRMKKGAMQAAAELHMQSILEALQSKPGFVEDHGLEVTDLMQMGLNGNPTAEQRDAYIKKSRELAEKADQYDVKAYEARKQQEKEAAERKAAEQTATSATTPQPLSLGAAGLTQSTMPAGTSGDISFPIENLSELEHLSPAQKEQLHQQMHEYVDQLSDDLIFFTHVSYGKDTLASVVRDGLNVGAGLNGTTLALQSKTALVKYFDDFIDGNIRHRGGADVVLLALPKTIMDGKNSVQVYDEADDYITDTFPDKAGFTVPIELVCGVFTDGRLMTKEAFIKTYASQEKQRGNKPSPVASDLLQSIQTAERNRRELQDLQKEVVTAYANDEIADDESQMLYKMIEAALERLSKSVNFEDTVLGSVVILKPKFGKGEWEVIRKESDALILQKWEDPSQTKKIKIDKFTDMVQDQYTSEEDYRTAMQTEPVTSQEQATATQSQTSNAGFITNATARQQATKEAAAMSQAELNSTFLSSLGCK